jgi:hypothetical protein
MSYLTDGLRLYEVVAEQADRNYGRLGGWIRKTLARDCASDEIRVMDDLEVATLRRVEA